MDLIDFQLISTFLEEKSSLLWKHEKEQGFNRTYAKIRFDESNFFEIQISGRKFYVVSTRVFRQLLTSVLAEACETYPENFGTGCAEDVLYGIYKVESFGTLSNFQNFLNDEQFAWIVELYKGVVNPKVLRVQIYRKISSTKEDTTKTEFTGGILHLFKHFKYKGIALSTKGEKEINHPNSIIDFLIYGFFFAVLKEKQQKENKITFESKFEFHDGERVCCAFYYENESGIYFVNSARPD